MLSRSHPDQALRLFGYWELKVFILTKNVNKNTHLFWVFGGLPCVLAGAPLTAVRTARVRRKCGAHPLAQHLLVRDEVMCNCRHQHASFYKFDELKV